MVKISEDMYGVEEVKLRTNQPGKKTRLNTL